MTSEDDEMQGEQHELFPYIVSEDALTDLPPVTSFSLIEGMDYHSQPKRPYQLWMRRSPPNGEPTVHERGLIADKCMRASQYRVLAELDGRLKEGGLVGLGKAGIGWTRSLDFSKGVMDAALRDAKPRERHVMSEWMKRGPQCQGVRYGKKIKLEMERCMQSRECHSPKPLRDHRPAVPSAVCNERIAAVPRFSDGVEGADWRDMPGSVEHGDGERLFLISWLP